MKFIKGNKSAISVLGNGPSCHQTFKKNFQVSDKIMVVNFMALTDEFFEYKPEYYVLIDENFFIEQSEQFIKLRHALTQVDWMMYLFVPASFKKEAELLFSNKNIVIKLINFNYLPGRSKFIFSLYNRNLATPIFQNVIAACLYTSINLGYKEVKLHGVESSEFQMYQINDKNEIIKNTEHHYGTNSINLTNEKLVRRGEFWKLLRCYTLMLEGYSQISYYSDAMGCKIINYTKNSFIDSFDKR
ncbi:hypothetical protein [Vibrio bathopelagicus]